MVDTRKKKEDLPEKEKRIASMEIRALDMGEDQEMRIQGYAIVFDKPATHYGFTEIIARNALDEADMKDVVCRYNHNDDNFIMARTRNKSLKLTVDSTGLLIDATLIDTQSNRDLYKSIQAGLIDKMSFAFSTEADEWDYDTDTRTVTKIRKLFDVSVVDTPFYDDTSIYARALRDLEKHKGTVETREAQELELEKEKLKMLTM